MVLRIVSGAKHLTQL